LNTSVSYMTQKDTLLPWRTALDNTAMPLELRGVRRAERRERARAELDRVGVGGAASLRPHELSGGMRSRVAMARSILSDAPTLLMDEPFAAIDALARVKLQELLIEVWQKTQKTIVYVTHDLNEAITLGHRVVVMGARPGRVHLVREIETPHPRDAGRYRASAEAQQAYIELWDALESQVST
jgi:NitT/TauT family transport system ATP-binding protein